MSAVCAASVPTYGKCEQMRVDADVASRQNRGDKKRNGPTGKETKMEEKTVSESQSGIPPVSHITVSGVVLLVLNGLLIVAVLWLFEPLIKIGFADPVAMGKGFDLTDRATFWAASLLILSFVALFGLWRCYRPTQGWSVTTIACLSGLVIHGFAGTNLNTNWSSNQGVIVLAIVRIILGILLALDLFKYLKANPQE